MCEGTHGKKWDIRSGRAHAPYNLILDHHELRGIYLPI